MTTGGSRRPVGYREVVLDRMPSLARLLATALGRTRTLVLARDVAGRDGLPEVVLRVDDVAPDAAGLADYQHLLGEPGTDELPAGYVHVLAFPLAMAVMTRADFPLQVLGLVHLANRVEQLRPVHLEESLTVRAWAEQAREHHRGVQVDLVVEVTAGGDVVWRGTSTYLSRRRPPGLTAGPPAPRTEHPPPPPAPRALWRLGADTGRRYADVSGDRNPIHVSRLGARLFGFRRPIAHGMYTAARALAATPHPGSFVWTAEFGKPVLLPTTVAFARHGERYTVWDPRSGKVHLSGAVHPL